MIRENHRNLTADQADLLRRLRPEGHLSRAAFHGRPFRIEDTKHLYTEELVLDLVRDGLLRETQRTEGWPGKSEPCAFTIILTTEGEKIRAGLISGARQPMKGETA